MYRFVLFVTFLSMGWHDTICAAADIEIDVGDRNYVQMEIFIRSDKPSAVAVREYAEELTRRIQGLQILTRDVRSDRSALEKLYELTKKSGRSKPVVPAFHCCDRVYFGFESPESSGPAIEQLFTADVYTRSSCPKCNKAKAFIASLQPRWPAVQFQIYEITQDANARQRWEALCRGGGNVPGLPTIDFGRHVIVGYQGDDITGKQLEELIERKAQIEKKKMMIPSER